MVLVLNWGKQVMKGLLLREVYVLLTAPINLALALVTPLLYGLMFSTSMAAAVPTIGYQGLAVPFLHYVLPGIVGFGLLMFSNTAGPAVFQERASGMLREIATSPVSALDYAVSKIISNTVIASTEGLVLMVALAKVFGFCLEYSSILAVMGALLLSASCLVSGFNALWAAIANVQTASLVSSILTMVMLFSAPVFYSESTMPQALQFIGSVNPMTYVVRALRQTILGSSLDLSTVLVLSGLAIILVALSALALSRSMTRL